MLAALVQLGIGWLTTALAVMQAIYYARGRTVIPPTKPVTNAPTNLTSWHATALPPALPMGETLNLKSVTSPSPPTY